MRNKIEFENRVREIAAQKKREKIKKLRNATIAVGGVLAACLVVGILIKTPLFIDRMLNDIQMGEPGAMNNGAAMAPDEEVKNEMDDGCGGLLDMETSTIVQNSGQTLLGKIELVIKNDTYVLNGDVSGRISTWISQFKNAETVEEYDITGEDVYEVHYHYEAYEMVYLISGNYIKIDDEWKEISPKAREEFDEIIKQYREE